MFKINPYLYIMKPSILIVSLFLFVAPTFASEPSGQSDKSSQSNLPELLKSNDLTLGFYSWNEKVQLQRSDGVNSNINSSVYSPGLGFRHLIMHPHYGFVFDGALLFGLATSQNESGAALNYFQRGASMYGVEAGVGTYWRPESKLVSFGLFLPLIYRTVQYSLPTSNLDYKFDSNSKLLSYLNAEFTWEMGSHISIIQRFGTPLLSRTDGYLWQVLLGYQLH